MRVTFHRSLCASAVAGLFTLVTLAACTQDEAASSPDTRDTHMGAAGHQAPEAPPLPAAANPPPSASAPAPAAPAPAPLASAAPADAGSSDAAPKAGDAAAPAKPKHK